MAFAVSPETHRDIRKLKDGVGNYLWHYGVVGGDTIFMFLGHPIEEDDNIPFGEVKLRHGVEVGNRCGHCGTRIMNDRVSCSACGAPY